MEGRPDFIKTYMMFTESIGSKPMCHGERGLSPDVLRAVVRRAHASGLRVSSHAETARDFDEAVKADVDEVNHLPLSDPDCSADLSVFTITRESAALAGQRGVTLVATANVVLRFRQKLWDEHTQSRAVANQRANLRLLHESNVRITIGSDGISGEQPFVTGLHEAMHLHRHRIFDNLTLLKIWAENTPATIFPNRKIGRLIAGFEANFLVLEGNPLSDFANIQRIAYRVKSGMPLELKR